jgi:hypothetical protein
LWEGEIKEYYVQRGSGKLILQDIRFEKERSRHNFEIRQGGVTVTVSFNGNSLLVLSVSLLLSPFLVLLGVAGGRGGDRGVIQGLKCAGM